MDTRDSNKDAAQQFRELGRSSFKEGDFDAAMRRLSKSQRLYPSPETEALLSQVQAAMSRSSSAPDGSPEASSSGATSSSGAGRSASFSSSGQTAAADSGLRSRTAQSASFSSSASEGSAASVEQITLVKRILRSSGNFYEVLEVSKTCVDEDVKKAYRKLSLKVHPDKNKAKGADEAFKIVSRAFKCLSDPDLRANYDRYGHEDPNQSRLERQRQARQRAGDNPFAGHPFFQEDIDPNDIFNAFFGVHNMNGRGRVYTTGGFPQHRRPPRESRTPADLPGLANLFRALPFILFLVYLLLPSFEPVYKMYPSAPHTEEVRTSRWHIPYYVKSADEFAKSYPPNSANRWRLDLSIEAEYKSALESQCYQERMQRAQLSRWGNKAEAQKMRMPYCDELKKLVNAY